MNTIRLVLALIALAFIHNDVSGQTRIWASTTATVNSGGSRNDRFDCFLGNCGTASGTSTPGAATDGSLTDVTVSTLTSSVNVLALSGAGAELRLTFPSVVPQSSPTVFVPLNGLPTSSGLLSGALGILNLDGLLGGNISVSLMNGASVLTTAVSLSLAYDKDNNVSLVVTPNTTTIPTFDGIRIRVLTNFDLTSSLTLQVKNAYFISAPDNCHNPILATSGERTGVNLSVLNFTEIFKDQRLAIDGDLSTHSIIGGSSVLSLTALGTLSQTIIFSGPSRTTDQAVVYASIGEAIPLANLGLLGGISIQAFNGTQAVGTAQSLQSLLSLEVLNALGLAVGGSPVPSGTVVPYYIAPGGSFDRVRVSVSNTVSLGLIQSGIKVYEAQTVPGRPTITSSVTLGTNNSLTVYAGAPLPAITATSAGNNILWYQGTSTTALNTGGNPSPYALPVSSIATAGDYVYYAAAQKAGCTNISAKVPVNIKVLPAPTYSNLSFVVVGASYTATGTDHKIVLGNTQAGSTYKFSNSTGVPPGLTLDEDGFLIGTPTANNYPAGGTLVTFKADVTDVTLTKPVAVQRDFTVRVYPRLAANTAALPSGAPGTSYNQPIPVPAGGSGVTANYTYVVTTGSLPAGLSIVNGAITGAPTTAGVYDFSITVTDPVTQTTAVQDYRFVVGTPLVASDGTLPNTFVNVMPYPASAVPAPTGGTGTGYTYAVTSGTTPPGLTFNNNGTITGSPTAAGSYTFTVTVTDIGSGSSVPQPYTVIISEPLAINNATLPNSFVGVNPYPGTSIPVPTGGSGVTANYTYAVTTGSAPTGLTVNSDGTISGTPSAAGSYSFTVTVTDPASGSTVAQPYTVVIGAGLTASTTDLPDSYVGATSYPGLVPVPNGGSGVTTGYTYTPGGAVPPGLTIASNGSITGQPTTAGNYSFSVTVNDPVSSSSVVQSYDVVISPKLALPGGVYPTAIVSENSYSASISQAVIGSTSTNGSATGGISGATLTYSLTPPSISGRILAFPTGFNLASNGTLTGNPNATGLSSNTFTVYVTDGQQIASNDYTLKIEASLPVKLASFKVAKEGEVAQLSWSTTSESNSESFEVQRSRDGKEWNAIGNRDAKGESSAIVTYNFTDVNPFDGENLYRLKMIDRDATFALSGIQSVRFAIESLKLYPNPVANAEPLNIQVKDWGLVKTVKVFNTLGKVVFESAGDVKSVVSTEQLVAGLYIVQVTRKDGQIVSSKFVKR